MTQYKKTDQNLSGIPQEIQQDPLDGLKYHNGFIVDPSALVMGLIMAGAVIIYAIFSYPQSEKNIWIAGVILILVAMMGAWAFYGSSEQRQSETKIKDEK